MSLKSACRKLFVRIRDDFNLDSAKSYQFYRSEWELIDENSKENNEAEAAATSIPRVSLKFLIYRGIYMLLLLTSLSFSTTCQSHLFHIFLTNWSFATQNFYSILFFINVLWRWWTINRKLGLSKNIDRNCDTDLELGVGGVTTNKSLDIEKSDTNGQLVFNDHIEGQSQKPENGENVCEKSLQKNRSSGVVLSGKLTQLEKAIWMLINIVHVLPYCVVLGYWCVVYKYDPKQPYCEKFRSHYIVHGATAVIAFFDALVIAIPARRTHFLVPTGLVLFYFIFTFLYEIAGGEYRPGKSFIYSALDWKSNTQKALLFSVLGVLVTPLAHTVFCWGFYKIRICLVSLYKRYNKN